MVQSQACATFGTRSGQDIPNAIGKRMSGGEHWASTEPSTNSTIEWTTDCGCTVTSMRSNGMSNKRWASISSSPLLTIVAELVVTTLPITQVGWASAWAGVTSWSCSRDQPRNGPPDAVRINFRTSAAVPPRRHWAKAECSLSTGTICPGLAAAVTKRPPTISDSLLAKAKVLPVFRVAKVGAKPIEPVMPLITTSASRSSTRRVAASAPCTASLTPNFAACSANKSEFLPAAKPTT